MKTLLALLLASASSLTAAQTLATNPMPDGSRDLYIGLGVIGAARYEGADTRRTRVLPLLQFEWSNGVFVSGLSAGMHLGAPGRLDIGPLLAWHGGRRADGEGPVAGGIHQQGIPGRLQPAGGFGPYLVATDGLAGMDTVSGRLQGGVFANFALTPSLRLSNSVLYGAGKWREGVIWNVALQHTVSELGSQHRLSLTGGANVVNASYNNSFFGVSEFEANRSGYGAYRADAGVQSLYLGASWNYALSPSWMLSTHARVTRLHDDARRSPLVQRPTNYSLSTGLAYRF